MQQNVRRFVAGACVSGLIGVLALQSAAVANDPASARTTAETENLIFQRQQLMEQLSDESEILGDIVAGLQPRDKLAAVTRSIAKTVKESEESFKVVIPGGRAKPEVWSNHPDFMKRMADFSRDSEALAKLGEAGDLSAVSELMLTALPCKQCHDVYRGPKKAL